MCESSCHSCPALHRRTGPVAPRDNPSLAEGHWFCSDRCFSSTAPTLAVPCSPMAMVTSVSQMAAYQVCSHPATVCLVDHVLHGNCPDVMILGSQRRTVAYYSRGKWQARCFEARCVHPPLEQACPQLGPLTGPGPSSSVTIPLSVLRMFVCVALHSPAGLSKTGLR